MASSITVSNLVFRCNFYNLNVTAASQLSVSNGKHSVCQQFGDRYWVYCLRYLRSSVYWYIGRWITNTPGQTLIHNWPAARKRSRCAERMLKQQVFSCHSKVLMSLKNPEWLYCNIRFTNEGTGRVDTTLPNVTTAVFRILTWGAWIDRVAQGHERRGMEGVYPLHTWGEADFLKFYHWKCCISVH